MVVFWASLNPLNHPQRETVNRVPTITQFSTVSERAPRTPFEPALGRMQPEPWLQPCTPQVRQFNLACHDRLGQVGKSLLSKPSPNKHLVQATRPIIPLRPFQEQALQHSWAGLTPGHEMLHAPQHSTSRRVTLQQPGLKHALQP